MSQADRNIVLAITGASGVVYGVRLLEVLRAAGWNTYLSISGAGRQVLEHELGLNVDLEHFELRMLLLDSLERDDDRLREIRTLAGISSEESSVLAIASGEPGQVHYCHWQDFSAPIASGSFLTEAMVICPCSFGTLGAIVAGSGSNLIHRAAEVHLKERRKLILVPRETPLSLVQLENMRRAAEAGAVILPAMPGFYHGATTVSDLVDFVVGRICDQLGIQHNLLRRWGM